MRIDEEQVIMLKELQAKVVANDGKLDLVTVVNMVEKINFAIMQWGKL